MATVNIVEEPISVAISDEDATTIVEASADITVEVAEVGQPGPPGPVHELLTFSMMDEVNTAVGTARMYFDRSATIVSVIASLATVADADVIVDVNKNGTTIFTTQANRPKVLAGGHVSSTVTNQDVTTLGPGDYLTVDVDQTGSGAAPGKDLTVNVRVAVT